jgi:hypothetical protein
VSTAGLIQHILANGWQMVAFPNGLEAFVTVRGVRLE